MFWATSQPQLSPSSGRCSPEQVKAQGLSGASTASAGTRNNGVHLMEPWYRGSSHLQMHQRSLTSCSKAFLRGAQAW